MRNDLLALDAPRKKRGRPFRDRSNDPDLKPVTLRAITLAGGMHEVGRARGISYQAVFRWLHVLGRIPVAHVAAMTRLSGIPMKDLRPDVEWQE